MDIIALQVPFREKDRVKALGAKWDAANKYWFIKSNDDVSLFTQWLPETYTENYTENLENTSFEQEQGVSLRVYMARISEAVNRSCSKAEWIRAEISKLEIKNGHCYIDFVETDANGSNVAQCSGKIWRSQCTSITQKFQEQTGGQLKDGIKILFKGKGNFHNLYGLSIVVEDIDPSYTIGDILVKLKKIRDRLKQEGIYEKNQLVQKPLEFTNVAVISPMNAAGLGDFQREADNLSRFGLCKFHYYTATFQGEKASGEITEQIRQAIRDHEKIPFDAVVILRGGGSVTDLAWLNDYNIAKEVCMASLPFFCGIGHKKDNTIIDEIVCERFDTPSKIISHIHNTIVSNAKQAKKSLEFIIAAAKHFIADQKKDVEVYLATCIRQANFIVATEREQIKYTFNLLISGTNQIIVNEKIHVNNILKEISATAMHMVSLQKEKVESRYKLILERAGVISKSERQKVMQLMAVIEMMNPEATMKRGFAIVKNTSGNIVISKEIAIAEMENNGELELLFFDGSLVVKSISTEVKK